MSKSKETIKSLILILTQEKFLARWTMGIELGGGSYMIVTEETVSNRGSEN